MALSTVDVDGISSALDEEDESPRRGESLDGIDGADVEQVSLLRRGQRLKQSARHRPTPAATCNVDQRRCCAGVVIAAAALALVMAIVGSDRAAAAEEQREASASRQRQILEELQALRQQQQSAPAPASPAVTAPGAGAPPASVVAAGETERWYAQHSHLPAAAMGALVCWENRRH
jgi:hypothetical protein